ncbi:MAG: hypothetical protein HY951_07565 [Bacteroidia bacterium]|nr:hypothetical protein [Bacteroidia bacterium]
MKTIKHISFFMMVSTALFFTACNSNSSSSEENATDSLETDSVLVEEQMPDVVFQVPSPDELFALIKNSGCKFRDDLMNSEKSVYESKTAQEINLGIYAADLAYLAAFEKFQPSLKYFGKVKTMSEQIGLATAIGSDTYSRLEKNIANADSLLDITNNSYYSVIQKLEENGNGNTLALIMSGGWIESMYIATNLIGKYSEKDPNIQRIASQKATFNNLIQNLEKYKDQPEVADQLAKFEKVKAIYDQVTKEVIDEKTVAKADSSVVIGQKSKYIFTKEMFESFCKEINNLRSLIIKMS